MGDLSDIFGWVSNAAALAARVTAANRKQARHTPRRREIVPVTDEMMTTIFAVLLIAPLEGVRLLGLVLTQAQESQRLTLRQREAFRFDEHARIVDGAAELLVPSRAIRGIVPAAEPLKVAMRVPPSGGDRLWCGMSFEAWLRLALPKLGITRLPSLARRSTCRDPRKRRVWTASQKRSNSK